MENPDEYANERPDEIQPELASTHGYHNCKIWITKGL